MADIGDVTDYAPDVLPQPHVDAADAVRRLGEALLGRDVDLDLSADVAKQLEELIERVEACPLRTKAQAFKSYPGHQRIEHYIAAGEWPAPPPDGSEVVFDALSFVGGRLNPFSGGARYLRDGDEAVAKARFSPCYEGPPGRVHGGMIASAFDEVMGAVFRVRGMASSFTGTLTIRYVGPAPIAADLEFRARLGTSNGRKYEVEATGTGPEGVFAIASATFIQMTPEQFTTAVEE